MLTAGTARAADEWILMGEDHADFEERSDRGPDSYVYSNISRYAVKDRIVIVIKIELKHGVHGAEVLKE